MGKELLKLAFAAAVLILMASCNSKKTVLGGGGSAGENPSSSSGRSVVFRAGSGSAGVGISAPNGSSVGTKTWYSGKLTGSGTEGKTERIDWQKDDQIQIYCLDCVGLKTHPYTISDIKTDGSASSAALQPYTGGELRWSDEPIHYFYALYPSPVTSADSSKVKIVPNTSGCVLKAFFPPTQTVTLVNDTLRPNMKFAYMYAASTGSPGDLIKFSFSPLMTAFQFSVKTKNKTGISKFTLSSESCALSGSFTGTVSTAGGGMDSMVLAAEEKTSSNNKITVDFGNYILDKGEEMVFTVLTLPASRLAGKTDILSDLSISFVLKEVNESGEIEEGESYTKTLKLKKSGQFIDFKCRKKYSISSLTLPALDYPITIKEINIGDFTDSNSDASFVDITIEDLDKGDIGSF